MRGVAEEAFGTRIAFTSDKKSTLTFPRYPKMRSFDPRPCPVNSNAFAYLNLVMKVIASVWVAGKVLFSPAFNNFICHSGGFMS